VKYIQKEKVICRYGPPKLESTFAQLLSESQKLILNERSELDTILDPFPLIENGPVVYGAGSCRLKLVP
jgi:hypothetical protein